MRNGAQEGVTASQLDEALPYWLRGWNSVMADKPWEDLFPSQAAQSNYELGRLLALRMRALGMPPIIIRTSASLETALAYEDRFHQQTDDDFCFPTEQFRAKRLIEADLNNELHARQLSSLATSNNERTY